MEMIFWLPTPLLIVSGIPQTVKLLRTKQSQDISKLTYTLTLFAVVLIFFKSIIDGSAEVAIANGASILMMTTNLFLILKYKNNGRAKN